MPEPANPVLNILLVEDDNDDCDFFKEAVTDLNIPHQITFAKDCFELFSRLDDDKVFDVIFLDINLPVMDGKECLRQIKTNEKYKDIPVIIFSGSHMQSDIDFVYEHGAHFHVVKPYAHINYLASLRVVLEINWKEKQPRPLKQNFLVNLTYNSIASFSILGIMNTYY